jgi:hypothetical protein
MKAWQQTMWIFLLLMNLGLWMLLFKQNLLNTNYCLGNNYKKFRYVKTHDMKVGLQCLELKAPIHFNFKCYLSQIKDLITLSKNLWWAHRKYIKDSFFELLQTIYWLILSHWYIVMSHGRYCGDWTITF